MGKDSANRWLKEIEDVCYLVRALGLRVTQPQHIPTFLFIFFFLLELSTTSRGLGEQRQRLSQLLEFVWEIKEPAAPLVSQAASSHTNPACCAPTSCDLVFID